MSILKEFDEWLILHSGSGRTRFLKKSFPMHKNYCNWKCTKWSVSKEVCRNKSNQKIVDFMRKGKFLCDFSVEDDLKVFPCFEERAANGKVKFKLLDKTVQCIRDLKFQELEEVVMVEFNRRCEIVCVAGIVSRDCTFFGTVVFRREYLQYNHVNYLNQKKIDYMNILVAGERNTQPESVKSEIERSFEIIFIKNKLKRDPGVVNRLNEDFVWKSNKKSDNIDEFNEFRRSLGKVKRKKKLVLKETRLNDFGFSHSVNLIDDAWNSTNSQVLPCDLDEYCIAWLFRQEKEYKTPKTRMRRSNRRKKRSRVWYKKKIRKFQNQKVSISREKCEISVKSYFSPFISFEFGDSYVDGEVEELEGYMEDFMSFLFCCCPVISIFEIFKFLSFFVNLGFKKSVFWKVFLKYVVFEPDRLCFADKRKEFGRRMFIESNSKFLFPRFWDSKSKNVFVEDLSLNCAEDEIVSEFVRRICKTFELDGKRIVFGGRNLCEDKFGKMKLGEIGIGNGSCISVLDRLLGGGKRKSIVSGGGTKYCFVHAGETRSFNKVLKSTIVGKVTRKPRYCKEFVEKEIEQLRVDFFNELLVKKNLRQLFPKSLEYHIKVKGRKKCYLFITQKRLEKELKKNEKIEAVEFYSSICGICDDCYVPFMIFKNMIGKKEERESFGDFYNNVDIRSMGSNRSGTAKKVKLEGLGGLQLENELKRGKTQARSLAKKIKVLLEEFHSETNGHECVAELRSVNVKRKWKIDKNNVGNAKSYLDTISSREMVKKCFVNISKLIPKRKVDIIRKFLGRILDFIPTREEIEKKRKEVDQKFARNIEVSEFHDNDGNLNYCMRIKLKILLLTFLGDKEILSESIRMGKKNIEQTKIRRLRMRDACPEYKEFLESNKRKFVVKLNEKFTFKSKQYDNFVFSNVRASILPDETTTDRDQKRNKHFTMLNQLTASDSTKSQKLKFNVLFWNSTYKGAQKDGEFEKLVKGENFGKELKESEKWIFYVDLSEECVEEIVGIKKCRGRTLLLISVYYGLRSDEKQMLENKLKRVECFDKLRFDMFTGDPLMAFTDMNAPFSVSNLQLPMDFIKRIYLNGKGFKEIFKKGENSKSLFPGFKWYDVKFDVLVHMKKRLGGFFLKFLFQIEKFVRMTFLKIDCRKNFEKEFFHILRISGVIDTKAFEKVGEYWEFCRKLFKKKKLSMTAMEGHEAEHLFGMKEKKSNEYDGSLVIRIVKFLKLFLTNENNLNEKTSLNEVDEFITKVCVRLPYIFGDMEKVFLILKNNEVISDEIVTITLPKLLSRTACSVSFLMGIVKMLNRYFIYLLYPLCVLLEIFVNGQVAGDGMQGVEGGMGGVKDDFLHTTKFRNTGKHRKDIIFDKFGCPGEKIENNYQLDTIYTMVTRNASRNEVLNPLYFGEDTEVAVNYYGVVEDLPNHIREMMKQEESLSESERKKLEKLIKRIRNISNKDVELDNWYSEMKDMKEYLVNKKNAILNSKPPISFITPLKSVHDFMNEGQNEWFDEVCKDVNKGENPSKITSGTAGWAKTRMHIAAAVAYAHLGRRVWICTTLSTTDQWKERIGNFVDRTDVKYVRCTNFCDYPSNSPILQRKLRSIEAKGGIVITTHDIVTTLKKRRSGGFVNTNFEILNSMVKEDQQCVIIIDEGHEFASENRTKEIKCYASNTRFILGGTPITNHGVEFGRQLEACFVNYPDEDNSEDVSSKINIESDIKEVKGYFKLIKDKDSSMSAICKYGRKVHKVLRKWGKHRFFTRLNPLSVSVKEEDGSKREVKLEKYIVLLKATKKQDKYLDEFSLNILMHEKPDFDRLKISHYLYLDGDDSEVFSDFASFVEEEFENPLSHLNSKQRMESIRYFKSNELEFCFEYIERCYENEKKIVISSESLVILKLIEAIAQKFYNNHYSSIMKKLKRGKKKIPDDVRAKNSVFHLYGSSSNRGRILKYFFLRKGFGVFVLSKRAGGAGIDLWCCYVMIIVEFDWRKTTDDQVSARVYRRGQTKNTTIIFLCISEIGKQILATSFRKSLLPEIVLVGTKYESECKKFKVLEEQLDVKSRVVKDAQDKDLRKVLRKMKNKLDKVLRYDQIYKQMFVQISEDTTSTNDLDDSDDSDDSKKDEKMEPKKDSSVSVDLTQQIYIGDSSKPKTGDISKSGGIGKEMIFIDTKGVDPVFFTPIFNGVSIIHASRSLGKQEIEKDISFHEENSNLEFQELKRIQMLIDENRISDFSFSTQDKKAFDAIQKIGDKNIPFRSQESDNNFVGSVHIHDMIDQMKLEKRIYDNVLIRKNYYEEELVMSDEKKENENDDNENQDNNEISEMKDENED